MFLLLLFWNSLIICTGEIVTLPSFKIVKDTPAVLQFNSSTLITSISCTLIIDGQGTPVYTYDAANTINEADGPLKHRAVLILSLYGFELRISQSKISDSGEYRCKSGPNIWSLNLIVEGKPEILKESHTEHEANKHEGHPESPHHLDVEPSDPHVDEASKHDEHGTPKVDEHGSSEHKEHEFEEEIHLHVNYCSNPVPTLSRWYFPHHDYYVTADTKLEKIQSLKKEISRYCFQEEILLLHIDKEFSGVYMFKLGNQYGNESISYHVIVLPEKKAFDPVLVTCMVIVGTAFIVVVLLIIYWFVLHKKPLHSVDHMAQVARKGAYSQVKGETTVPLKEFPKR